MTSMFVITYRKIFFAISGLFVLAAFAAIFFIGLNFGIDFKGGSILEVRYPGGRPDAAPVNQVISDLLIEALPVQPTEESGFIIRTRALEESERVALENGLSFDSAYPLEEVRFNSVGPTLGAELRSKAWVAIATVIMAIILFIAYVFRGVSEPVSSWGYGIVAVIALIHDVVIPTGIFAALGYEIDSLFVIAALAILGLSVNDTIVVFDRIRENLKNKIDRDFKIIVGKSLRQTFIRSINTSLTVVLVLLALYFFGPESTQHFALVLTLGMVFGTYSSIFLASPLLIVAEKWGKKK
ncbi:MAG: protein translocase subunit SecF [Candidatus Yonathbacteria bacterium CG_4_10_14_3_um_filter_47_65]|uniref:Protein-export membrane protein SecF n=1 Tax=Candidatus Yonathbacteria bacterium CG_4_9_14_0_8_um_filter_46_47 TaxID=1975106 RepID=A0A2M8D7E4_9BACT|nr:MAG: protein translocase subunit SecF [Candidatus Yonathbacteria bacterium CG23_combo_of_CG06-09_8_20_14_all_46_18]PIQ31577.1 MAG: protein translocase subunit SecF [Candidatus Yonathbacteria bacterium CG17_big_fil_post_rev_8_21_14_2_50_46_19]PIX56222.1 MAG: protein translocase subunit SecF [Candidatus Yonathbacteria bacterium CG_4_10_14_3_um_filter_47_65]PIY57389.1 MAG: protein translocase subunit SecF [Candidatus Yonathbacteria bacterium CG_4_10_14_0_8_um_filter_47_645]PJB83068.1 MAG: prote